MADEPERDEKQEKPDPAADNAEEVLDSADKQEILGERPQVG